jgi:hypothetical protein
MSASLPWIFMRWLATHLVLIALMLFALAAFPVFGWVEVPALLQWTSASSPKTVPSAQGPPAANAPQVSAGPRFKPVEEKPAPVVPPAPPPLAAPVPGFRPPGLVPLTQQAAPSRDERVQQARRLFWNGEFEAAETAYMELVTRFPSDADLFGELGNLYRGMGRPEQARDAYYAAGLRLKAVGELEKLKLVRDLLDAEGDARVTELTP